jgi:hypothetical protein
MSSETAMETGNSGFCYLEEISTIFVFVKTLYGKV